MLWVRRFAAVVLMLVHALPALAQDVPVARWPILILRQDDLFEKSAFGVASTSRIDAANAALLTENRKIEAALEAEERDLTERRVTLPPAEFHALSEAFNAKVEGIRTSQEAKARAITRTRDEDRQRFLKAAVPVLAAIMQEEGAQAILDEKAVVLSFDRIDITAKAIARIDAAIGNGSAIPPGAPPQAPGVSPTPAPLATPSP